MTTPGGGSARTRVLFCIPQLERGGPDAVFFNLLGSIDRERFEPILVVTDRTGGYLDEIPDDVEVVFTDPGRYPVVSLIRIVRRLRPDVVLATLRMNTTAAAARPLFPRHTALICRVANNISGDLSQQRRSGNNLKTRAIALSYRTMLLLADLVIAQSASMRDDIERTYGLRIARKVMSMPNPVDAERIERRAALGFDEQPTIGSPQLVSVGRLGYQKGYDLLLPAFARLRADHPDARLWLVGDGPDRDALDAQATDLGIRASIDLVGFVDNPAPYVAAADLYVCSSRYEGFSNALAESVALGTPAVAPRGAGAGDEIIAAGDGILVDVATEPALLDAMTRALTADPPFDPDHIRASCRQRFSVDSVARRYETAILDAARRRLPARRSS